MHVDGQCHCGSIRYSADADPEQVAICHCTDCQVLTGSPYRVSVVVPASGFRLLAGEPTWYVKTAESGNRRVHGFCPTCGTPVFARPDSPDPQTYTLRIGNLAQREALAPRRQIWCRSALPWSKDIGAVPSFERQGTGSDPTR
jgi:hypothetical protein